MAPKDRDSLARDLLASRREVASLRRENASLRAHAAGQRPILGSGAREVGGARRCPRCGFTLHRGVVQHDQTLVFASSCPRCDGPLVETLAAAGDPSIYLG